MKLLVRKMRPAQARRPAAALRRFRGLRSRVRPAQAAPRPRQEQAWYGDE
jgi:hypothetical protein